MEGEIAQLEEAWLAFEAQKRAAAPELECLAQAARALTLEGEYAHLVAVRKQQGDEQSELTSAAELFPNAQLRLQAAVDALGQAELELKKARDEQQREAELIRTTRELDVKLGEANSQVKEQQADSEAIKRQCGDIGLPWRNIEDEISARGPAVRQSRPFWTSTTPMRALPRP